MSIFDLLYPKRCTGCNKSGTYFCAKCITGAKLHFPQVCPVCERPAVDGATHTRCKKGLVPDGLTSIWAYEGVPRKLISKLKYKYVVEVVLSLASPVGGTLKNWTRSSLSAPEWQSSGFCIVPIPLHWTRNNRRGFNHAEEIAKILAQIMQWRVASPLRRKKMTGSQVGLKEKEREKNIKDAFVLDSDHLIPKSSKILLFDDVWTSGSTMKEAVKVLKKAGFNRVWCLTLAR
ncbi:hypothetical protein CMO96_04925 [Candidatus Woesebacteria bacterium]|nr:hypothetical protein [Candidatus Woesebacteria bacterium]